MNRSKMWIAALLTGVSFNPSAWAEAVPVGDADYHRSEWRASTFTFSAQHEAALDLRPDGQIVAVWSSRRQQEGRAGVYMQRFGADGVAIGSETAVGLWRRSHQGKPAIAVGPQGNTWIAWQSHDQDGHAGGIIARRFDPTFEGGPEIAVNQHWRGHQSQPVLAVSGRGTAVVVWWSSGAPREPVRLRARRFGPDGRPLGDEFAVSAVAGRPEMVPSAAFGQDDAFAIVFSVFDQHMKPAGIRLQRFDATGKRLGEEVVVSGPPKTSQIEPVIAASPTGYIVAWLDAESDGSDYGVLGRRFDTQGRALGEPFVVNTVRAGSQNAAALAVAADGRFAIAWNGRDDDESGICAQLFAADGTRLGDELCINRHTKGEQRMQAAVGTRRLAFGPQGELICIWSGDANLGDKSSVNLTMLSPRALHLAGRQQGVTQAMQAAPVAVARADGPGPHRPPTFDPQAIDHAAREIRLGPDFGFTGIVNTGWVPPDPHLAVGPEQIVAMTNGAIAFFEKDGTKAFQQKIEGSGGFWGSVGASGFVFDPEVLYDELSGRFFAMAVEAFAPPGYNHSYVLVAVSDDSDPGGPWHKYRFDTTWWAGDLLDSPNIGVDRKAVYITGDGFGKGLNYPVFIFDKASLLGGAAPSIQKSLALPTSTQSAGIPPVSFDDPPALYMIEHAEGPKCTTVRLIALRDPLGEPHFTTHPLTVPSYSAPQNPPQLGTSVRPDVFDARFWSVVYRNGSLWATHHVGSNRVRARWYEIAMRGWPTSEKTPVLVQSGEIDPGPDTCTFFSAIGVNERGDAAITCAASSSSAYISMLTACRLPGDPPGTFRKPAIHRTNAGPYSAHPRWGDYGAVIPDPADVNVFWAHHEYAEGDSWRTWIAKVDLPFRTGDMNCDGKVNIDDIDPFTLALHNRAAYQARYPNCNWLNADCNGDGAVDFHDIDPFVALIGG